LGTSFFRRWWHHPQPPRNGTIAINFGNRLFSDLVALFSNPYTTLLKKRNTPNDPKTPEKVLLYRLPHKKCWVSIKRVWKKESKNEEEK
jgi:hypothetical protein